MTDGMIGMSTTLQPTRARGFTLIELMITIVIGTILMMIAIPLYEHQIQESRRTDAKTAVLDLASREQRYYSLQNSFTASFIDLGYSPSGQSNPTSVSVGSGYYTATLSVNATPPGFTVTATATGTQTADTACQTYTVDQTGLQKAYDSTGADNTSTCWQ